MNYKLFFIIPILAVTIYSFSHFPIRNYNIQIKSDSLGYPDENHLKNITQLTFGGENAECYFSFDGTKFTFQSTRDENKCDQIYTMKIDGSDQNLISTGTGRTTCSYYMPDGKQFFMLQHILVIKTARQVLTFHRVMSGLYTTLMIYLL